MRTELQGSVGRRRGRGLIGWLRSLFNRATIAKKDRIDRKELAVAASAGPTIQDRQQELVRFYKHYEDLIETLCDAANFGPNEKLENNYRASRQWMHKNYPPVRRYITAYLRYATEDAQQSIDMGTPPADAFEALTAAASLEEFLRYDDGNMIDRITRTREALVMYGQHLRQLSSNLK